MGIVWLVEARASEIVRCDHTMTRDRRTNRRGFLATAGIGGATLLAGCLSAPTASGDGGSNPSGGSSQNPEPELDPPAEVDLDRIAADPADVPPPVDWTEPRRHEITLVTEEYTATVADGVTFDYMTYEGQVPGPMIRVRRGDTIHLRFEVPDDLNAHPHNVDFHAVYGPGGGAEHTTLAPGDDAAEIEFTTEYPGIHIYHCAVPNMDQHISAGMFGAILVEPEGGLDPVDREFYLGQHEIYTQGSLGESGHHSFSFDRMQAEDPTYVVFNGTPYAFTEDRFGPLQAETGETIRVYFANGGPNLTSAWHPIGNVWSRLYRDGDLLSDPAQFVETVPIAPGTVVAGEMETPVPGPIKIVDHALSRAGRRGALGVIDVDGEADSDIYDPDP